MRRRKQDEQNLDSLLDTMTNVVGILVILLALTQVSMGSAVQRIQETDRAQMPSEEEIFLAEEKVRSQRERIAELEGKWAGLESEANRVRTELSKMDEVFENLSGPGRATDRLSGSTRALADLEKQVKSTRGELARIEVALRRAKEDKRPKHSEVRLPDPRPPPPGASKLTFFARYGRLYTLSANQLLADLDDGQREALGLQPWETPHRDDRQSVVEYFRRNPVGRDGFRWRPSDLGRGGLLFTLEWTSGAQGERVAEVSASDSRFRLRLSSTDSDAVVLEFFVWEDSFEVYLRTRQLAEDAGFSVGWTPMPVDREIVAGESHFRVD